MSDLSGPGVDQPGVETSHGQSPPGVLQLVEFRGCSQPQFGQTLGITGGQSQQQPLLGAEVGEDEGEEAGDVQFLVGGEDPALVRPTSREEEDRRIGQSCELDWRIVTSTLHHPREKL